MLFILIKPKIPVNINIILWIINKLFTNKNGAMMYNKINTKREGFNLCGIYG